MYHIDKDVLSLIKYIDTVLGDKYKYIKIVQKLYKYKYRVLRNVLGYYPSTFQMHLGTITK